MIDARVANYVLCELALRRLCSPEELGEDIHGVIPGASFPHRAPLRRVGVGHGGFRRALGRA